MMEIDSMAKSVVAMHSLFRNSYLTKDGGWSCDLSEAKVFENEELASAYVQEFCRKGQSFLSMPFVVSKKKAEKGG